MTPLRDEHHDACPTPTMLLARAQIAEEYIDAITPPPQRQLMIPAVNPAPAERYELLEEIARGGMGILIRTYDHLLNRVIVIKVLRAELAGCELSECRFLREARINSQLQHPGIVPVYDVGRFTDGRPYLTMKYVAGDTFETTLARRSGPWDQQPAMLRILIQVCQTIAYAHARDVIHRDLKPANIMVAQFGQVRVLDWGLAISTEGQSFAADRHLALASKETNPEYNLDTGRHPAIRETPSVSGTVVGTPAYMAPEQTAGA
ncbi:MAG: serine/threonine-protein kinase, partial [Gemmataceae bacterium]